MKTQNCALVEHLDTYLRESAQISHHHEVAARAHRDEAQLSEAEEHMLRKASVLALWHDRIENLEEGIPPLDVVLAAAQVVIGGQTAPEMYPEVDDYLERVAVNDE